MRSLCVCIHNIITCPVAAKTIEIVVKSEDEIEDNMLYPSGHVYNKTEEELMQMKQ